MIRQLGWLLLGCALLGLCACPQHRGIRVPEDQRFTHADKLLAAMAERASETHSIRAQGVVDMRRKGQRIKAHMLYVSVRPARLRFETHSFFDQPLSILVLKDQRFSVWDLNKGRFMRGAARPENIARMLPVPLAPEAVVSLLMGEPPVIPFDKAELHWQQKEGLYLLKLEHGQQREEILVHPKGLHPMEAQATIDGKVFFSLTYKDWQGPLPRKVEFEMPEEQMKLKLRIKEVEADPELPDSLFELTPPEGMIIEELE